MVAQGPGGRVDGRVSHDGGEGVGCPEPVAWPDGVLEEEGRAARLHDPVCHLGDLEVGAEGFGDFFELSLLVQHVEEVLKIPIGHVAILRERGVAGGSLGWGHTWNDGPVF